MNNTEFTIPAGLQGYFRKPPLLISESRSDYDKMLNDTIIAFAPTNTFEWLLVKDIADLTWELRRLGKNKAGIVNLTWKEAINMIVASLLTGDQEERRRVAQERADVYFTEEGQNWVLTLLAKHELTVDSIAAQATTLRLPELNILDRRMERIRVSRMAIARDISYHRVAGSWKGPEKILALVDAKVNSISLVPSSDSAVPAQ
jgi:hypothetical protein